MKKLENYNQEALRGVGMTDAEHAEAIGIDVPESLFGTPEYNDYVIEAIYQENYKDFRSTIDPMTGETMTDEVAQHKADMARKNAQAYTQQLLSKVK